MILLVNAHHKCIGADSCQQIYFSVRWLNLDMVGEVLRATRGRGLVLQADVGRVLRGRLWDVLGEALG